MDEYYRAVQMLPSWLARPLAMLSLQTAQRVQELRLRAGHSITLTVSGRQFPIETLPECPPALRGVKLDTLQIEEVFHALCGGSVHTHQTELSQGFLTAPGGCRVGVAGRFADRDGCLVLQQVTALNLRVAREISSTFPEKLHEILNTHFTGMIVSGEPGSGKTTFLRQIASELGKTGRETVVLDERRELFPSEFGHHPPAVDVLSGVPKEKSIQMALRTLSPQVILLDELGGMEEVGALEQGFFSGVDFIASIHASGLEDALRRPQICRLRQKEMLRVLVQLHGRDAPGQIEEVRAF